MYLQRQTFKRPCGICNLILIKKMKKIFSFIAVMAFALSAFAQEGLTDAQKAAADAANTIQSTPVADPVKPKPQLWEHGFKGNLNFGQTCLVNWAAGGYNSYTLKAYVDGHSNFKSEDGLHFWNNRLQLDYGMMYSADKPIIQKTDDRIYLESKWGYRLSDHWFFATDLGFKSQFAKGYDYKTPAKTEGGPEPGREEWKASRVMKSAGLSPAYLDLAFGIDYDPFKWLSINVSPLTGSMVAVTYNDDVLRKNYGMPSFIGSDGNLYYRPVRMELGARFKADVNVTVNDVFTYNTQLIYFQNYLKPFNQRVNWDNKIEWRLLKYFALCLNTSLIYDSLVMMDVTNDTGAVVGTKRRGVQFMESLTFGFTYSIASKKK